MLEFEITLGPLHLALRLGDQPTGDIGYLLTETELADDDADTTETRTGFRGK